VEKIDPLYIDSFLSYSQRNTTSHLDAECYECNTGKILSTNA